MPRYAAIDIGSNSLRMLAAEVNSGGLTKILAEDREVTRLGESVFRTGRISAEAMELVCQVLARMAESYRNQDVLGVRVVATSAVRDASNQREFLSRASKAVGSPVEIISGQEEARLIHLGVQSRWPHPRQRILVVDVGGGSAEIILSEHGTMAEAFSKPLGAVRLTEVFLRSDPPTPLELHQLDEFIQEKTASALRQIGHGRFDRAIATSATAAAMVCAVNRLPRARREAADRLRATRPQVRKLMRDLCGRDLAQRRKMTGIGLRRAEIIVAGTAVFHRMLEDFQLPSFHYSAAGVRDGIIADLAARRVGRELTQLNAEQRKVVEQMARRYGVALKHVRKVASFAHDLFVSLQPLHRLPPEAGKLLEAAAYLHDVGHFVSDTGHHKHSAYLVANSDLPGFTDQERHIVALLCRYHRKSMPSSRHDEFQTLGADLRRTVLQLTPLLRLADGLDRSHDQRVDAMECQMRNGTVVIALQARADTDLEQWAGERAGEIFRQVYEVGVSVTRARRRSDS